MSNGTHMQQMHQVQHPVPTFNVGPSQQSGMQYTYNTFAFDHSSNLLLDQNPNQVAYAPESQIPQMHQVQHPVPTFNVGPSQHSGMQYTYNTSAFDHSSNLLLDQNPNQVAYAPESHIPQMHQVQHPVPRVLPQTGFDNSGPSAHSKRPHAYPSNMLLAHIPNSGMPSVFDYPYNTMWVQNMDGGVLLGMHNGINPTDEIPTYFVPTNLLDPGCANCRLLMEHAYGDPFNTLLAQNPNVGMMRGMNNEMTPVNNNTTSLGNYGHQIGNSGFQLQAPLHQLSIPLPPPFSNLQWLKEMGFEDKEKSGGCEESGDEKDKNWNVKRNESEDEGEDAEGNKIELGPQYTLKEQFEKDKDDESLRKWKEQLLGNVDINDVGESLEPDVKIVSLSILSPGRSDIVLPVPQSGKLEGRWFTLKEGSRYSLRFSFQVSHNIVAGLKYTNNVWKTGVKVDSTKEMLGTFSPQAEPYTYEMPEETTPSGYFARGSYSAKSKFLDDDNKAYLDISYSFDIRKDWANTE